MPPTHDQTQRYARHITLREIGGPGQKRLQDANIAIVGLGGIGGPAALYLAAAGIGHLTLIDDDTVSLTNLHRQILFDTDSIGTSKTSTGKQRLARLNPHCRIKTALVRLDRGNASDLLASSTVVLDGSDNFATRLNVNDTCVALRIPLIAGAVRRWQAHLTLFDLTNSRAPCYRCLIKTIPAEDQDCARFGIAGPLTGIVGAHMALEAVKHITRAGQTLSGRLLLFDGLSSDSRIIAFRRDRHCPSCSHR